MNKDGQGKHPPIDQKTLMEIVSRTREYGMIFQACLAAAEKGSTER